MNIPIVFQAAKLVSRRNSPGRETAPDRGGMNRVSEIPKQRGTKAAGFEGTVAPVARRKPGKRATGLAVPRPADFASDTPSL
ncbi:hypothetical protein [Roseinatronobacter alkalisoli]|uniref:Uncharacterized protein n=1 Tax=Roseinatronobacter alkalisoli TaxID=3028235 RepID=A0ABT5T619_9RHOB|nr:hypothetical protein [Roseinatronobacter sp. HJB301]MDD7970559.1 hypothetical protein [Roseinatronobacter sp. HJB301]